jgi:hypothetical protein
LSTTEKIVEAYFRLCRRCFTLADLKVPSGNNRQIDLLACNLSTGDRYHVEVSVTHQENWCPNTRELLDLFEKKFFGAPPKRDGPNTDYSVGKNYSKQILEAYRLVGIDPDHIKRVWVCWTVADPENLTTALNDYYSKRGLKSYGIEVISFRDEVLPALLKQVSTSNYDDDALRTLSLLRQFELQRGGMPLTS